MEIIELGKRILKKGYVCDNCLGRQFSQLLTGLTNKERGEAVRMVLAMEYEAKPFEADLSNFYGFRFRNQKLSPVAPEKCSVCGDLFKKKLSEFREQAVEKLKNIEFDSFLVGTRLSSELIGKEEELWEEVGIKHCEPIKAEINRELGKLLEKALRKRVEMETPDVNVIVDVERGKVGIKINSLFIFGKYKKLVRGIPQTKWETYEETVEDIIAEPVMKATGGEAHSLHGAGREDVDARCLDWRPFVFEVKSPEKRKLNFKAIEKAINRTGKVEVSGLRVSDKREVRKIKELKQDKTYRVLAVFEKPLKNLDRLRELKGEIRQHTPERVLHRRADRLRKRKVKSISWEKAGPKKLELKIRAESGLYVKELVTGDGGRTRPSVSGVLDAPAKVKELDVVKIWGN
jgi:tRNA pseudouridine synthase 10